MLKEYKKCIFCNSNNLKIQKNQKYNTNFYIQSIISDFELSKNFLKKIKVYKCKSCYIIQNNPWFDENFCRKIYSNVYGQHNRGWTNLIRYIKKKDVPNHGKLFDILNKNLKIKTYAEFNSPFMGMFFNFFDNEIKKNSRVIFFFKKILNYLTSRQVAGLPKNIQKKSNSKSKKALNYINNFRNKNIKEKTKKYLFEDNSILSWGQNDNYKSVSSKSFATEFFNIEISKIKKLKKKIDLFGIFHTLDHTLEPKKIFDFAIGNSKCLVVYCHVDEMLNKQHLFSITKNFLKYLKKKKLYFIDITSYIDKKFTFPELYFVCSKQKNYINTIKSYVSKKK